MELKRIWMVATVMLLLVTEWKSSNGCLDHEKTALLKLQTIFEYQFPSEFMFPWLDWGHNSDCCQWNGVICDNSTKNVIKLDLSPVIKLDLFSELNDNIYEKYDYYYYYSGLESLSQLEYLDLSYNKLNNNIMSSLSALSTLKNLSLSANNLQGTLYLEDFKNFASLKYLDLSFNFRIEAIKGFESLSKSSDLEYLDLTSNKFNNSILPFLGSLPSLKILNLGWNAFQGTIHIPADSLLDLEELDISGTSIKEFVTPKGDKSLSKLEILYMEGSFMDDVDIDKIKLLQSMGPLPFLKTLYLQGSTFNETTTTMNFPNFKKLEVLDLSFSRSLNSKFLQSIQDMNALKVLKLGDSGLNGTLLSASQGLCNSRYLEVLDLSENHLAGTLPACLANLTSLQTLDLSRNQITGDVACLANLTSLQTLYLSDNQITGDLAESPITSLERLSQLEYLDLSYNNFNNNILPFLGSLPSLKMLNLRRNAFQGTIHIQADSLLNLEELDISGTSIKEFVTPKGDKNLSKLEFLYMENVYTDNIIKLLQSMGPLQFLKTLYLGSNTFNETTTTMNFSNFKKLEVLDMSESWSLNSKFLQSIQDMNALKVLKLTYSGLNGNLSASQGLCNSRYLQVLDLGFNDLAGTLPACLANLTSLTFLDMSGSIFLNSKFLQSIQDMNALKVLKLTNSRLNGNLSASQGLCNSRYLEVLDLGFNDLSGTLPACLANLTSLQTLDLSHNQITGDVACLANLTSLQTLDLSDNQITQDVACLANLTSLQTLDLSHNQFTGDVACLANLTRLYDLDLKNNSLSRLSDFSNRSHAHLEFLDVSNNLFNGGIPLDFGVSFPNLRSLNMSSNQFDGHIPSSFGDMSVLETLDISNNKLFGKMPKRLGIGCVALQALFLSNNSLEGQIFSSEFNLTGLGALHLEGNNFSGRIPDSLSIATELSVLDISSNNLSGSLPKWMGKMSNLWNLKMSKNHLEGPIPLEFCQLTNLHALDLSENDISGMIPSCFNPPRIQSVRLSKNKLQGTLEHALSGSSSMLLLDLSNNQLIGSIPKWIHRVSHLNFLLLNNNYLGGEIPIQLCQLDQLSLINLSQNDLYGTIPDCLRITPIEEQHGIDVVEDPREVPNADAPAPTVVSNFSASAPDVTIDHVEFPTKRTSYDYQGEILNMMSGIDLSCNKFFGEIPPQLGNLNGIRALNLSHNNLSGSIPPTFGNLKQVESLDLSDNLLTGKIPPELGGLSSLGVFSVANNNLSGEIPTTTQFTTFNESNFQGNPLLCGAPLPKSCNDRGPESPRALVDHGEDGGFMDMECFYASFGASYLTVLLGLIAVLLINPYWRGWWFYHIEKWTTSSYYFVVDNLPKRFFPWKV